MGGDENTLAGWLTPQSGFNVYIRQIARNYAEAMECLEATVAILVEKMGICNFYASIYMCTGSSFEIPLQKTLQIALPNLLASVIVFSVKAHQYFDAEGKYAPCCLLY